MQYYLNAFPCSEIDVCARLLSLDWITFHKVCQFGDVVTKGKWRDVGFTDKDDALHGANHKHSW